MSEILMPKATAVWLLDNTTLTFTQISAFCGLHHLEVKGIADGDVAENMRGVDPIAGGILSREEIARGEENPDYVLKIAASKIAHIPQPPRKGSRYTPVVRRADKPDAVAWFIRNHPEVSDAQISGWNDEIDDQQCARQNALEFAEYPPGRPGDAGSLHADRAG